MHDRGREEGRIKVSHYWGDHDLDGRRQWNYQVWTNLDSAEDVRFFQEDMQQFFVRVRRDPDILHWGYAKKGAFSIKEAYNIKIHSNEEENGLWKKNWVTNQWPKVAKFSWLVSKGRILTGENLKKQGFIGPSLCPLCYHAEETMGHLLDSCIFVASIWDKGALNFRRSDR